MFLADCGGNSADPKASAAQINQLIDLQGKVIQQIGAVDFKAHATTFDGSEYLSTAVLAGFRESDLPLNSADLSEIGNAVNGTVAGCSIDGISNSIYETIIPLGRGVQAIE